METELDNGEMFEMPHLFCVGEFFINENGWRESSQKYLIHEHNDWNGLKGIVYKALIDRNRMFGFECLSKEDMHFHLLCTILYYNSNRYESVNTQHA